MASLTDFPRRKTYNRSACVTFRKTTEEFGGLSNMARGYPLNVNGIEIFSSEALYQACRFPHLPEVQRLIIAELEPINAKKQSIPYRDRSRTDWHIVRTMVMRWCLHIKLIQNWDKLSNLLLKTNDLAIVEDSGKDDFWGAVPHDSQTLTGINMLGYLLMKLREQIKQGELIAQTTIHPLSIPNFYLYGEEITPVNLPRTLSNSYESVVHTSTSSH